MSAGSFDITVEEGADFAMMLDYKDSNDTTIDLSSGFSARIQIRESVSGDLIAWGSSGSDTPSDDTGSLLKHATVTMGATVPNISIAITGATTNNYTPTQFEGAVYQVELFDVASITRIMEGHAYLSQRVLK